MPPQCNWPDSLAYRVREGRMDELTTKVVVVVVMVVVGIILMISVMI